VVEPVTGVCGLNGLMCQSYFPSRIIAPGFVVDMHIHYWLIGSPAEGLPWLRKLHLSSGKPLCRPARAAQTYVFHRRCCANGVTGAGIYFPRASRSRAAGRRGGAACMIAGKVLMDQNAPDGVQVMNETSSTQKPDPAMLA
jgi:cytosine/adenosine deaminase-related metal-dependent hydrolase